MMAWNTEKGLELSARVFFSICNDINAFVVCTCAPFPLYLDIKTSRNLQKVPFHHCDTVSPKYNDVHRLVWWKIFSPFQRKAQPNPKRSFPPGGRNNE